MSRSLDSINSELAEVTYALIKIEADDIAGRLELATRRNELRTEARRLVGDSESHRPTTDIVSELVFARKRRDALAQRRSRVMGPQGHGVSTKMVEMSSMVDRPSGLEALITRVSLVESVLTKRGVDIEVALQGRD